jgi:phage terminase large subunit-like protein
MIKDRDALKKWEQVADNIRKLKTIEKEAPEAKEARIERLKKDFPAFCRYYFPEYASAPFAKFHIRIANKLIQNDSIYLVAALHRECGKSVLLGLFIPAYLMFTGKLHNMLLVSHSYDNAKELLMPLALNMEHNQRIINDYGQQKGLRTWEAGNYHTVGGHSFRAIGAGQSPRGSRNEEKRPDFILIDDIDTDEEGRNQSRIDNKWKWIEQALFPTMSISGTKRFVFAGNIIAKESTIVKASRVADFYMKVNILDAKGNPSWERYSKAQVDYMISKISYASAQKEYFNNPISEGTVFKEVAWGKVPPMTRFKYLVAYCDPSYKASKNNDFKAIPLVGELNGTFYVFSCYLEQTSISQMISWFYDLDARVGGKAALYNYIEAGSLQDTFYQELFLPKLIEAGNLSGKHLSISPDHRAKPDKFTRIEATLEPLNRQGRLIFNEAERDNPHMLRLEEQMKAVEPGLPAHDDGPDALEGAVHIINNKLKVFKITAGQQKQRASKKY